MSSATMSLANIPTIPLEEDATFLTQLKKLAKEAPERPAFISYDKDLNRRVLTRQDVWDKSQKFAAILKRRGITKGDIVCNTLFNSPERLITCFGTVAAGAITMHGQLFRADGEDLKNSLKESQCKAIVIDSGDQIGASRVLDRIKYIDEEIHDTRYSGLPHLTHVFNIETRGVDENERFITSIDKEEEMFEEETVTAEDVVAIFATSGTTGFSKLVLRSHSSSFTAAVSFGILCDTDYPIFSMQSLGWIGGFPFPYVRFGQTRVYTDFTSGRPSDISSYLVELINKEELRFAFLTTRDLQLVLGALDDGMELRIRLKILCTGGGPIHKSAMNAIGNITDEVRVGYGATEFGLASALRITDKSHFQDMCCGYPYPSSCQIKIVGDDTKELPLGKRGEVLVRNQSLFQGYLNNPTKTREAYSDDGFYKTGDIGYFDESGCLFVLGRKSNTIAKGSFIHYCGWIEKLINGCSGIEECVVIGVPDPVLHEEICLCMKLSPGAEVTVDEVRKYCEKLFLSDQKSDMTPMPQYILLFDAFVKNANGKVERQLLKQEACRRLNINL